MEILLIILGILGFIGAVSLKKNANKAAVQFTNRPTTIVNPEKDLFTNQKYAIVGILAFIQGASSQSAFDDEANRIIQNTISSLGLSRQEVEKYLRVSMNHSPEYQIDTIIGSLKEIRDHGYLVNLYQKCLKIARISGDNEIIEITKRVFNELGIQV